MNMAEIYLDAEQFLQFLVVLKKDIVVCGHCPHLRKAGFDLQKRQVNIANSYCGDAFQECISGFSVHDHKQYPLARLSGDNEIALGITTTLSFVDGLGSFVDECPVLELAFLPTLAPPFATFPPMSLNPSAPRA